MLGSILDKKRSSHDDLQRAAAEMAHLLGQVWGKCNMNSIRGLFPHIAFSFGGLQSPRVESAM